MTQTYQNEQTYAAWRGHDVVDSAGQKLGKVEEIYLDDENGQPEWLTVKTGLFGNKHSFVPLAGATAEGDTIRVAFDKDVVTGSPRAEAKDGVLTPGEEESLFEYYGQRGYQSPAYGGTAGYDTGDSGYDTSGPTTDDAMTRSEEELRVGKTVQESGRARLRKWIETEHVSTTVPTRHESVRVEREPITEANIDRAMSGPELSEEEHEVVLHDEVAVAATEVVPKERVRMVKEETVAEQEVGADLRKERIAADGTTPRSNGRTA